MAGAAIDLAAFLAPERVAILRGSPSRRETLELLAGLIAEGWDEAHRAGFLAALFDRELLTTTAIGGGLAVPHARVEHLDACRVALGIVPAGVSWESRDGQPVRIVVCIAAREQQRTEHLQLLAAVASRLADPARRERLIAAEDAATAIAALR